MSSPLVLGTAFKITTTTLVNGGGADSATISIYDSEGTAMATDQAMTDDGAGVFSYAHQSAKTDPAGWWRADVSAVSGAFTSVSRIEFETES